MGDLFKLGTRNNDGPTRRDARADWHGKVWLAPYRFRNVRLFTDGANRNTPFLDVS